jgi:uncharacterized protein YeaO (DUF488 family)
VHLPILAPTKELLDSYKKESQDWPQYEREFLQLMRDRKIEETVSKDMIASSCFALQRR